MKFIFRNFKGIIQDVPQTLTQQIRNFARQSVNWMRRAVEGLTPQMAEAKINAVSRFSSHLRRLTSLNHLAREARPILSNQNMITQMMNDLNKIDFHKIQVCLPKKFYLV